MSIDKIMNLGDDAMSSRFYFTFPKGIPGGGDDESISLRMDQDFDPPSSNNKTFKVKVRLDEQWKIYDDLNKWLKLKKKIPMTIKFLLHNNEVSKRITYKKTRLKDIKIGVLNPYKCEPVRLTLTFSYSSYCVE